MSHGIMNYGGGGTGFASLPLLIALLNAGGARRRGGRRGRRGGRGLFGHEDYDGDVIDYGGDDEDWDEVDEAIGAQEDAEIERLLSDDYDDYDDDSLEGMGASLASKEMKLREVEGKISDKKAELAATPNRRRKRRRKLASQIQRLSNRANKLRGQIQAKSSKARAKHRRQYGDDPPPGMYTPGVVPPGIGSGTGPVFRPGAPAVQSSYPVHFSERQPGTGMRIPFRDTTTNALVSRATVVPGNGLRLAALNMATVGVSFGEFRVRGLEVHLQAVKPFTGGAQLEQELLINVSAANPQVAGSIDLLLQEADITQTMQTANGQLSGQRTLTGIREDAVLDKTNTANITFNVRQEITTTATNVEVAITAAVIVDRIQDRNAQRSG